MRWFKAALTCSIFLLTTACGHVHTADVASSPNPPPPPGYRAVCSSTPLLLNAFITGCTPVQAEQVTVVQAKG